MKLYLVSAAGTKSELKNLPKKVSREAALIWLGAYIRVHSRSDKIDLDIQVERPGYIRVHEVNATEHYILED